MTIWLIEWYSAEEREWRPFGLEFRITKREAQARRRELVEIGCERLRVKKYGRRE